MNYGFVHCIQACQFYVLLVVVVMSLCSAIPKGVTKACSARRTLSDDAYLCPCRLSCVVFQAVYLDVDHILEVRISAMQNVI